MPTYKHFQQAKKALPQLPKHDKVGACLTCKYWKVPEPRMTPLVNRLALCIQPSLKPYALLVSGSSACNKWKELLPIEPEAKAYATRGEPKD